MRLIVDVYRGCSYYPDKTLRGLPFWVNSRIKQLQDEGYECKVREIPRTDPNDDRRRLPSGSLRAN